MLIDNRTNLGYEEIGQIIDKYIADGKEDTLYVGKRDTFRFRAYGKIYDCSVTYLKKYVKYIITEVIKNGRKD